MTEEVKWIFLLYVKINLCHLCYCKNINIYCTVQVLLGNTDIIVITNKHNVKVHCLLAENYNRSELDNSTFHQILTPTTFIYKAGL